MKQRKYRNFPYAKRDFLFEGNLKNLECLSQTCSICKVAFSSEDDLIKKSSNHVCIFLNPTLLQQNVKSVHEGNLYKKRDVEETP